MENEGISNMINDLLNDITAAIKKNIDKYPDFQHIEILFCLFIFGSIWLKEMPVITKESKLELIDIIFENIVKDINIEKAEDY